MQYYIGKNTLLRTAFSWDFTGCELCSTFWAQLAHDFRTRHNTTRHDTTQYDTTSEQRRFNVKCRLWVVMELSTLIGKLKNFCFTITRKKFLEGKHFHGDSVNNLESQCFISNSSQLFKENQNFGYRTAPLIMHIANFQVMCFVYKKAKNIKTKVII